MRTMKLLSRYFRNHAEGGLHSGEVNAATERYQDRAPTPASRSGRRLQRGCDTNRCGCSKSMLLARRDVSVHRIGREVNVAGPGYRALIYEYAIEEIYVGQRRKNTGQFFRG
jgi:hypothetical protein